MTYRHSLLKLIIYIFVLSIFSSESMTVNAEETGSSQSAEEETSTELMRDPAEFIKNEIQTGDSEENGYILSLKESAPSSVQEKALNESQTNNNVEVISEEDALYKVEDIEEVTALADTKYIDYIEPNKTVKLFADTTTSFVPNDLYYTDQWGLSAINVESAWDSGNFGSSDVSIALIDSGINNTHEDLLGANIDIRESNNLVTTDTTTSENWVKDTQGHGTMMTGILAATVNNGLGIAGLMPETTIVPIRVFDSSGECTLDVLLKALSLAIDEDVDVINMSLGSDDEDPSLAEEELCDEAVDQGILVVAAAGNYSDESEQGTDMVSYPAAYESVIGVGSIDSTLSRSSFSYTGDGTFVVAPGENIYTLSYDSNNGYMSVSGTSAATPFVAALAAYAKSIDNSITQDDFKSLLESTSEDLGTAGWDKEYGYGLIDFDAFTTALTEVNDTDTVLTDSLLVRRGNTNYVKTSISSGEADYSYAYGKATDTVLVGDWDGDGVDTLAVRRGNTYYIKNSTAGGEADQVITYGKATDTVLVGDWDGDGVDTLAVKRGNLYYIKNEINGGEADKVLIYGKASDSVFAGDWDGDGVDTLAVRRNNCYYFKNTISGGTADQVVVYGKATDTVLVGDWDGDAVDTLAVRRGNLYYFKNTISGGTADQVVVYGKATDTVLAGKWKSEQ